jgi:hypothetical protein
MESAGQTVPLAAVLFLIDEHHNGVGRVPSLSFVQKLLNKKTPLFWQGSAILLSAPWNSLGALITSMPSTTKEVSLHLSDYTKDKDGAHKRVKNSVAIFRVKLKKNI